MKAATISQLRSELQGLGQPELITLCLRLARFKAENKELLTYLLYEQHDELSFANNVKQEMDELFTAINFDSLHYAKKSIRKIGRVISKYNRFSGSKRVEAELLIHFCRNIKDSGFPLHEKSPLYKFYTNLLQKISRAINTLHPDLQFDYRRELDSLSKTRKQ
ncbi:MAG TPA: hypothetical protein DCR43_01715 [Bacteroidales bacterium]|nr:MAG: hypothetical protein A2X11_10530 [Bacteroidetes bacterium GWE2_42_24]OFY28115.1 MAG: hypothetical protein A2X09_00790 [Bacteroidetes bacterium GWF2_43_11]PKP24231.1 MAG: hypothetical protein CVU06_05160 [Bacteroidetes bacterium HGW-Bacteroidetes-22]HAQ64567.1 hypothetical protein [Bacteroidales bacterium]HBZ65495.1 hypothetical protein [Bacteroidales bacterium]